MKTKLVGSGKRGFCGIGIYAPKTAENVGSLVRSARCFGADFVFTIGQRYKRGASSVGHERHIPILNFEDEVSWMKAMPNGDTRLVAVEITEAAATLPSFQHPERAVYLLGSESVGVPDELLDACEVVQIPTQFCLNVATAGAIVLYDRRVKS